MAQSEEVPFPGIGMLYVEWIDGCEKIKNLKKVPDRSTQYFLSKSEFKRIEVKNYGVAEVIELAYPKAKWSPQFSPTTSHEKYCSFGIAIHSPKLEVANDIGINSIVHGIGQIRKYGEVYYWGR